MCAGEWPVPVVEQQTHSSVPTRLERSGAVSCAPPPRSPWGGYHTPATPQKQKVPPACAGGSFG
eukprot:3477159-Alexandrium_andersonii.AAC.1